MGCLCCTCVVDIIWNEKRRVSYVLLVNHGRTIISAHDLTQKMTEDVFNCVWCMEVSNNRSGVLKNDHSIS